MKQELIASIINGSKELKMEDLIYLVNEQINFNIDKNIYYEIIEKDSSIPAYHENENLFINKVAFFDEIISDNSLLINKLLQLQEELEKIKIINQIRNSNSLLNPYYYSFLKDSLVNKVEGRSKNNDIVGNKYAELSAIKTLADFLSYYDPKISEEFISSKIDYFDDNKTKLKVPDKNDFRNSVMLDYYVKTGKVDINNYKAFNLLYKEDGSKNTCYEVKKLILAIDTLTDSYNILGDKLNKKAFENKLFSTLINSDPLLKIDFKLQQVGKGEIVGRNAHVIKNESDIIIDLIKEHDVEFYDFITEHIENKIKHYQSEKQSINKRFTKILNNVDMNVERDSFKRKWLRESETSSRKQEMLVNLFNKIKSFDSNFKEIYSNKEKIDAGKTPLTVVKEIEPDIKISKFIKLNNGVKESKLPNYMLYNQLLRKIESDYLNVQLGDSKNVEKKNELLQEIDKKKTALDTYFSSLFDQERKLSSIKMGITILNKIYEKIKKEKLENVDLLFTMLEDISVYLRSIDEFENNNEFKVSRYKETDIGYENYVKRLKEPEELEIERVISLQELPIDKNEELNLKYNKLIYESLILHNRPKEKSFSKN